jgi:16S rRNA (guanine(966)-N(2))-methyltransferase RsmD
MRVIGGIAKGRKLLAVPGDTTRPILDRVKTSLFDILRPEIQDKRILDLFAGSGAVGIEALSQGASHCTFIDLHKPATKIIAQNLENTGLTKQASVQCNDSFRYLKSSKDVFDIIYVAPPQYKGIWVQAMQMIAERPNLVSDGGALIVQIDPIEDEKLSLTAFRENDRRVYGSTLLIFYVKL